MVRGGIRGHCRNSGGIIKAGENVQGANAVAGAVVYVVDANGKIRDYTFSASDGGYEMTTMMLVPILSMPAAWVGNYSKR